jgi:hypothetical protein
MIDRQYSSYCFLAFELPIEKKIKYSRQAANSQSMGFAINISHYLCQIRSHVRILIIIEYYTLLYSYNFNPIKNNMVVIILLWFKCVLTALHVNCMILFDKVL